MNNKNQVYQFKDQLNDHLELPVFPPQRIVSLVPSITELLFDLGLENRIMGVTKFCVHPRGKCKSKEIIGGTKNIHLDKIDRIQPDLIIANKEENEKNQVENLKKSYPVWVSDVDHFKDALEMISTIGSLTGSGDMAKNMIREIESAFTQIPVPKNKIKVAYLIWQKPYMAVGSHTFIHDMLQRAGFENIFADAIRYPEISLEILNQRRPEIIFLSSEPYPFKEKHQREFEQLLPNSKILLVDGEMFSWYGSRMLISGKYFGDLQEKCTKTIRA
ncbi:MAG: ABC transporter substrate-binding protein [Bacteroidetes bacterium]|nr:ABC transporter substrate-binding protein [Bacteroidota bacterium]